MEFNIFKKRENKKISHQGIESNIKKEIANIFKDDIEYYSPQKEDDSSTIDIPICDVDLKNNNILYNTNNYFDSYFMAEDKQVKKIKAEETKENIVKVQESPKEEIKKVKNNTQYHIPTIDLLDEIKDDSYDKNKKFAEAKSNEIINAFTTFGYPCSINNITVGPKITRYAIKVKDGIKVNGISTLRENIQMVLTAADVKMLVPIPNTNLIGIDATNMYEANEICMHDLIKGQDTCPLSFPIGKDILNSPIYCDFQKNSNFLVCGPTGSGKTDLLRTIITSLIFKSSPNQLKIVLMDNSKVSFLEFQDIPHLFWPVINETNLAILMLKKLSIIAEERLDAFNEIKVKDIADFNSVVAKHNNNLKEDEVPMQSIPYLVVFIDELYDLTKLDKTTVEDSIERIAKVSNITGIYIVVATQLPSYEVISTTIKSFINTKIAFKTTSKANSQLIIDDIGAEQLTGNDFLLRANKENKLKKIHRVIYSDDEIERITNHYKKQAGPEYDDTYFEIKRNLEWETSFRYDLGTAEYKDPLYDEVVEFVVKAQKASTSLLQRRFGIGFLRSEKLIDELEKNGIIGPPQGSKPREVYKKGN